MIDIVFNNDYKVRGLWREYYDMLNNEGLNNPMGWEQRNSKLTELLTEMAAVVGYGNEFKHLDAQRIYSP